MSQKRTISAPQNKNSAKKSKRDPSTSTPYTHSAPVTSTHTVAPYYTLAPSHTHAIARTRTYTSTHPFAPYHALAPSQEHAPSRSNTSSVSAPTLVRTHTNAHTNAHTHANTHTHGTRLNLLATRRLNKYYQPVLDNMVDYRVVDFSRECDVKQYYSELHKVSNEPHTYQYFVMVIQSACGAVGNTLYGINTFFKENTEKEIVDSDTNVVVANDKTEFEKRFKEFVNLPCDDHNKSATFESFLNDKYEIDLVAAYNKKMNRTPK